eukprot:gnl/TRDRNA2_/TRDRNA2_154431_c3_seq2.p1 gnl/TRDRNA2_/TRDRNA2_154431_c3~~gnl/TRDRNA2_/TRDRNA2_154431_c3_seq2.p1  ORF type:complete len:224 (+),score=49.75 gnl/TRDRNA2_/TRDRNA2_154431_c3_seq2:75-674(+)
MEAAPACGQNPESLGAGFAFRAFTGAAPPSPTEPFAEEVRWLEKEQLLRDLALMAFRYAFKIVMDAAAMAEDATDMEDGELEKALEELQQVWHVGIEGSVGWREAMEKRTPSMMTLRKKGHSEYQLLRLVLREDNARVGELRPEVVHSVWASVSLELRYFTNDDDERYSIQAHPTLLRNLIVQSAEYPIYVSPPTTVWV